MVNMHFGDAAKYATMINQPAVFVVIEISQLVVRLAAEGSAGDRRS